MAHNLERYNETLHAQILYAAMLDGTDVSPAIESERFIGFGDTKHGYGPACILDLAGTQHVAEPHVIWFPWTTPGNRIVNFKWAMSHLAETRVVFLTVEKKEIKFFEHFVRRGMLRKIGFINDLPIVEEIHMYQYLRGTQ